jgi:hypothetical protein
MADVSKIIAALAQAVDAVGAAQNAADQAGARAQQIQQKAARAGFRGIAAGMTTVIERIKRIQQMHAAVASSTKAAAETVQGVDANTSPDEVVSTLTPVMQQIDSATTDVGAISAEVDAAKTDATAALKGGKPGPMLAALDQIKQAHTQLVGTLADGKQRTEETITEARETGNVA